MLLAIDVGNTNTVFALCKGKVIAKEWRMRTDAGRTADEYGAWLLQLLAQTEYKREDIRASVMSSVVPDTLFPLHKCCETYFGFAPMIVGAPEVVVPMEVDIDRPAELGADRLVNAYGAWQAGHSGCIIVDFGTATTFDVVGTDGCYKGGVIAPGVNLSLEALHHAAAKLPSVAVRRPEKAIGTSTVGAMQSGVFYGYLGLIEGIIKQIRAEYDGLERVIATGGLAPLYGKATDVIDEILPDLTTHGLIAVYNHNTK